MKPPRAGLLGLAAIVMTFAVGCASSATPGAPKSSGIATSSAASASAHTTPPAAHKATVKSTAHTAAPVVSSAPAATYVAPPQPKAAPPQTTAAPPPQAGCYPLTNGGNCYEPGEFCRTSDHGVTGVAGDGKAIKCEYNNGWRWEPI